LLKPRDILHTEFRRVLRGYNPVQVDEFLRRVVVEYEALAQENMALKQAGAKVATQPDQAATAQAEEILAKARREAEEIIAEARKKMEAEKQQLLAWHKEAAACMQQVAALVEECRTLFNRGLDSTAALDAMLKNWLEAAPQKDGSPK